VEKLWAHTDKWILLNSEKKKKELSSLKKIQRKPKGILLSDRS
jgi:hypothetical protein